MGRASKEEAERTRARIVETASDLFRASGVAQVSVADIMSAIGLTTGGFYKHFASKEALVAEALELAFTQASSNWRSITAPHGDDLAAQRAELVRNYLRPHPEKRCPMISYSPHTASAAAEDATRSCYREGTEALLDSFLTAGRHEDGAGERSPAERKTMLLFAAMIGARVLKEAAGDAAWAEELRNAVIEAAAADI